MLTVLTIGDRIHLALLMKSKQAQTVGKPYMNMERYRSGHNEAVLKTVCPQGRVGSNPTLSAGGQARMFARAFPIMKYRMRDSAHLEKYPRGRRDTPVKGAGR